MIMKIKSAALLRNCLTLVLFGSVFMPSAVYARSIGEDLVIGCRALSPSASAPKTQEDAVFLGMCLGTAMSVQEDMKSQLNLVIWYNNHRDQMEKTELDQLQKKIMIIRIMYFYLISL